MVVYEVIARPRRDLREEFVEYMNERHIPDMRKTGYFLSAILSEKDPGEFQIKYELQDRETLDAYFANCAEALREDFAEHFPEGIEIERKIYSDQFPE